MRTAPCGVLNCAATQAGVAVVADPLDLDVLERPLDRTAQPLADPVGVPGDLQAPQVDLAGRAAARVVAAVALPLHEERQLRVGLQPLDTDLPPAQLVAVGTEPVAGARTRGPSRASTGAMSSTATTQPSQPPPGSERARTAWPNGALSEAGWSRTSTTSR